MKITLILFVTGMLLITAGYAQQMKPSCEKGIEVKYIPRNVFDQLEESKPYAEESIYKHDRMDKVHIYHLNE